MAFKRRPDLDLEAFRIHWQTTHREVLCALPGVQEYWQYPTLDSGYRKHEPTYDGVAEVRLGP
ncbi:EthD domain-containing protein [Candidatus Poriferisodalis sp.]|uniref:EthD domain-containing protein n=1 Tax=Candidatus Poriferisodalis sp. TaxID=3101277 RepID=UPI003AF6F326